MRKQQLLPAALHAGQAINKQPGGKVFPVNDYSLPGTGSEQSASAFIEKDDVKERNDMKEYFAFQWHITDECDQRCKHCYIFLRTAAGKRTP